MAKDEGLAPENFNSEQRNEQSQSQTIASDAMKRATAPLGANSEADKSDNDIVSDGVEDVVDKMDPDKNNAKIDMDAYRGEPNHDDYVEKYGKGHRPGDTPVNADS